MTDRHPSDIDADPRTLASIRSLEAVRAPAALRDSLEELVHSAPRRQRRRMPTPRRVPTPRLAGAGALAAAVAAAAVLVFAAGPSPTPTALDAARVALKPASLASPAENPRRHGQLEASVEGVSFPYWGGHRGWPAAGARTDRLDGRAITTVFYAARDGQRVGYAIVAGHPLPEPTTGAVLERGGVRFHVLDSGGATVVVWREVGHTCILAARGVPARTLLSLVS
jgi:hypothetical protein